MACQGCSHALNEGMDLAEIKRMGGNPANKPFDYWHFCDQYRKWVAPGADADCSYYDPPPGFSRRR